MSVSTIKLSRNIGTLIDLHIIYVPCLWLFSTYNSRVELLGQRSYGPQSLNIYYLALCGKSLLTLVINLPNAPQQAEKLISVGEEQYTGNFETDPWEQGID